MMRVWYVAALSPTSPTYTQSPGGTAVVSDARAPQGPTETASQSLFLAPPIRQTPRSAPVVSNANSRGSFPESLIVNNTPGWVWLIDAPEFSTSSLGARTSMRSTLSGTTPSVSAPRNAARPSLTVDR